MTPHDSFITYAPLNAVTLESTTTDLYDESEITTFELPGKHKKYGKFINWGSDNQLPYTISENIYKDIVLSQNKFFNILTCYGSGLQYRSVKEGDHIPPLNTDVKDFLLHNRMPTIFLGQVTDMKYYFFSVCVIILSVDGAKIVRIRQKDAANCRFQKTDSKGMINNVAFANWRKSGLSDADIEVVPLLDHNDPIGDLHVRMGKDLNNKGQYDTPTTDRKFAVVTKFPIADTQYYPIPYYSAIFTSGWYDINQMILKGKSAKLKNSASIPYQVEVHVDYWDMICRTEGITDPEKKEERITREKTAIKEFVSGINNTGKLWISGFYTDPASGKEVHYVKITMLDISKAGGDYSDDIEEYSNLVCYADNIHPNLVGSTPGRSKMNNSGSDKRELFTLKQSIEKAFHDIIKEPHNIILAYNNWIEHTEIDIPIITLTVLSDNKDAKKQTLNPDTEL